MSASCQGPRHPGQLGNVNTVGAIGGAGHDSMQEDDAVSFFQHVHAGTTHARQDVGQLGQLMKVRCEEGPAAEPRRVVQVLDHSAGDGQTVPGRGAAADLVEQDEAALGSRGGGCWQSPASPP